MNNRHGVRVWKGTELTLEYMASKQPEDLGTCATDWAYILTCIRHGFVRGVVSDVGHLNHGVPLRWTTEPDPGSE